MRDKINKQLNTKARIITLSIILLSPSLIPWNEFKNPRIVDWWDLVVALASQASYWY